VTELIQEQAVQPVPDACRLPVTQASPASHARTASHFLGEVFPGDAGLEYEENARKCGPMTDGGTASFGRRLVLGQNRFDDVPQNVG
jgi:hypothetical protein